MRAVGQFDQDNPNILHHGQHHFAKVFRLRLFAIAKFELIELRHPVHQLGD